MVTISLSGHLAVVTGATGQLGRVIVRRLAEAGADVVLHYHSRAQEAEAQCEVIRREYGVRAMAVGADVGDFESVIAMRERIRETLGEPDILVDNAVIQYDWKSLLDQPIEDYESQFRSCVMQNVNMAKAFLPAMQRKGFGRMIGINTECSMQCFPTQSAYVAGKRGMDGIMRVLAKEMGPYHITVNQVAPGWTISDRDRQNHTESRPEAEADIPLRRRGTDAEIADAVLFLASPLAEYITGAYLPVCGGHVMPTI